METEQRGLEALTPLTLRDLVSNGCFGNHTRKISKHLREKKSR